MPSTTPEQQRLFGQAYAVKKGDLDPKDLNPKYRDQIVKLADSMTLKQLGDYAKTKHSEMEESTITKIGSNKREINELNSLATSLLVSKGKIQDPRVKKEAISRLSDFFRVSPNALSKFDFDGKDDIKALTKALNSTSDEGTALYYRTAIKLAKEEFGIHESEEIQFSTGYVMKNILSFDEFLSESQLNEGAKITPKELSREGKEFIKWFEKTMASGSVKSIVLEDNTAEITFNQNIDISKDLFDMVREWPNAPSYMDLYVDVMSVNRGQLVMMIYGKSGMSFTL